MPDPSSNYPINIMRGTKAFEADDFTTEDAHLDLTRYWNSRPYGGADSYTFHRPPLGLGDWRYWFQYELHLDASNGGYSDFQLLTPMGGAYAFKANGAGAISPTDPLIGYGVSNPQIDYKLAFLDTYPISNPPSLTSVKTHWSFTDPDDRTWFVETFLDPVSGKYTLGLPTKVVFRDGHSLVFAYGTYNQLLSITDDNAKAISFDWILNAISTGNIVGSVSAAHLPGGYGVNYTYTEPGGPIPGSTSISLLSKVEYLDAASVVQDATSYTYDPTWLTSINGVYDKNNVQRWAVTYDAGGRAISSSGPSGVDATTVSYGAAAGTFTRTVTNSLGKQETYSYSSTTNGLHNGQFRGVAGVASAHTPASTTAYSYGTDQFVNSSTDEEGAVTHYAWNGRGLLTQLVEAFGTSSARTTNTTWHATLRQPTQVQAPGLTTDYVYDTQGRTTSITETDTTSFTVPYPTNGRTRTWAYTWSPTGQLLTVDGPLAGPGDTETYTYNTDGYLQTYTDQVGHTTTVTAWDWRGAPLTSVDANSVSTTFTYDIHGRPLTVTVNPGATQSQYQLAYNAVGDISQITLPGGGYLQYTYNLGRQLTLITNNRGETETLTPNTEGGVTADVVKSSGAAITKQISATYDELNRAIESIGAAGAGTQKTTLAYDKTSNLTSVTDPLTHTRSSAFDPLSRVITKTDPESNTNQFAYNGQDKVTSFKDGLTHQTSYTVDGFGEVIQEVSPDRGTRSYWYSDAGKLTKLIDGDSEETDLTYDNAGRMTGKTFVGASAEATTYTYDSTAGGNKGVGRLTSISSGGAISSNAYIYDAQGRLTADSKVILGRSLAVQYAYDANGKVTQLTYPSGRIVAIGRATDGLVTGVTMKANSGAGSVNVATSVTYQPFGPLKSLTYGNGLNLTRTFDQNYWLTRIQVASGATTRLDLGFQYYDDGRMGEVDDNAGSGRTTFISYRDNGKLNYAGGPWGDESYDYDAAGNRTGRYLTVGGVDTADNAVLDPGTNHIVEIDDAVGAPTRYRIHRAGGDVTEEQYVGGDTFDYYYDGHKRVVDVQKNGSDVGQYGYDDAGRRVWRQTFGTGAATTLYVFDPQGHLLAEHDDATGNPLKEYVWIDDLPVAVVDYTSGSAATYYIHTGQMDEPLVLTNASKAKVWDAYVNPWGKAQTFTAASAFIDLRLPGQWLQLEANGLHQNGMRDYDPSLGRYVQADPLGLAAGENVYAYADDDPLDLSDPTGRGPVGTAVGATVGFLIASAGSLTADAVTGGLDVPANPAQIAFGTALGAAIGNSLGNLGRPIVHSTPAPIICPIPIFNSRPPPGSKGIDKTPWSGDHQGIKAGIGAGPKDNVKIDPNGNVWGENPDGSWTNHGPAGDYTGSGKPSGRRGKDR